MGGTCRMYQEGQSNPNLSRGHPNKRSYLNRTPSGGPLCLQCTEKEGHETSPKRRVRLWGGTGEFQCLSFTAHERGVLHPPDSQEVSRSPWGNGYFVNRVGGRGEGPTASQQEEGEKVVWRRWYQKGVEHGTQ